MKISIFQKLFLFAFIILAENGLIGYAVYKSNQKLLDSESWVAHTEQVINHSWNVLSLVKDIEIASRGFVITNDSAFLEPYNNTKTTFGYLEQLRRLTRDNPTQQQRIDSLHLYYTRYLEFSCQTIALRSQQGLVPAIRQISSKQGKYLTDHIRLIINDIQQSEAVLLEHRKQINAHSVTTFEWIIVSMFILMSVFTILLLIVTWNYLYQHKEKEKRVHRFRAYRY